MSERKLWAVAAALTIALALSFMPDVLGALGKRTTLSGSPETVVREAQEVSEADVRDEKVTVEVTGYVLIDTIGTDCESVFITGSPEEDSRTCTNAWLLTQKGARSGKDALFRNIKTNERPKMWDDLAAMEGKRITVRGTLVGVSDDRVLVEDCEIVR